jgi:hypothetical protein
VRQITVFLLVVVTLIAFTPAAAAAQDPDLEAALRDLGLIDPQVTLEADRALVIFQQPVTELGPIEAELERVARVLVLFKDHVPPEAEVTLQQRFDDGQIMQIVGSPSLGNALLNGEIDVHAFEMALRFEPLTRGPLIFADTCDLHTGDSCETNPACACYPNESCAPADPAANPKGCLTTTEPANTHLEGSEYACNEGYVWNLEMTGCEPMIDCPEGTQFMDGECIAPVVGTEPDAPLAQPAPTQVPEETDEFLTGLMEPPWLLICVGGGLCLLGLLAVAAVIALLVLRRRRNQS